MGGALYPIVSITLTHGYRSVNMKLFMHMT
jgi:hypothetical protein